MPGEDGAIHVVGWHNARVSCRTQGTLGSAEPARGLLRGEQCVPHDIIRGGTGEENVAAPPVELTRERVEETHRPVDLHGFGVLLDPHPAVVAGRLLRDDPPHGTAPRVARSRSAPPLP